LVHWVQPGEGIITLPSLFALSSLFVFAAFAAKSPAETKRNHYAIDPRRKENFVVLIGYILCGVFQSTLGAYYTYFFDTMVFVCDRFVPINR
jgi:hypothetical protein